MEILIKLISIHKWALWKNMHQDVVGLHLGTKIFVVLIVSLGLGLGIGLGVGLQNPFTTRVYAIINDLEAFSGHTSTINKIAKTGKETSFVCETTTAKQNIEVQTNIIAYKNITVEKSNSDTAGALFLPIEPVVVDNVSYKYINIVYTGSENDFNNYYFDFNSLTQSSFISSESVLIKSIDNPPVQYFYLQLRK